MLVVSCGVSAPDWYTTEKEWKELDEATQNRIREAQRGT